MATVTDSVQSKASAAIRVFPRQLALRINVQYVINSTVLQKYKHIKNIVCLRCASLPSFFPSSSSIGRWRWKVGQTRSSYVWRVLTVPSRMDIELVGDGNFDRFVMDTPRCPCRAVIIMKAQGLLHEIRGKKAVLSGGGFNIFWNYFLVGKLNYPPVVYLYGRSNIIIKITAPTPTDRK